MVKRLPLPFNREALNILIKFEFQYYLTCVSVSPFMTNFN